MIALATDLKAAFAARENKPVELYEISFEGGSTYYFSDQAITWNGNAYLPYVVSRSDIKRYFIGQFDQVSVTFSNVDTTMAQFVANNDVYGATLTIRKIDITVTDDSLPIFVGVIQLPGAIDEKQCVLNALERIGSLNMNAPTRLFGDPCGWPFKGDECLYSGSAADCDHSWANCSTLANTQHFGGFRFIPVTGTFQYQQTTTSRFLLLFTRKKTVTETAAYNSVDDTPYTVPIPLVLGRAQLQGIPIQHEDSGVQTVSLIAFCVGEISTFVFCLANNELINIANDADLHFGGEGGVDSHQMTDPRFPQGYQYTLLAYMGITMPSDVSTVDDAPAVVAVIMGKIVDFFDASGAWSSFGWSDNPVWNTREFLSLSYYEGGMGIPWGWLDDARNYAEAQYCDELIEDLTNDQKIYLPNPMPTGMVAGFNYRCYQSTCVDGVDPSVDGPYSTYVPGVDDDTSQSPPPVNVKRFTMNVALVQQDTAIDILQSKLLPSFRGYLKQNKTGQIQICVEKANPHALVTVPVAAGVNTIPCDTPSQFNSGDLLILGTFTVNAEIATVDHTTGGSVVLTAVTTKPHSVGDELLKISRAYNESNIVSNTVIQYPLSDRQSAVNRINVNYNDSPTGFQARTLYVNDYDNQAKVHAVNDQDLDASAIDSYFQAWRIGQWQLALFRDVNKFVSLRGGIESNDLEIGDDIIAVSAPEHGLLCVPFRVVELGFAANDEVDIVGQLYSTSVYDDEAPQSTRTVPTVFAPQQQISAGPMPYRPFSSPWLANDALFPGYSTFRTYTSPGKISLFGNPTINSVSTAKPPVVPPIAAAGGGGAIAAGTYIGCLVSIDATADKSDRSHYFTVTVGAGGTVTLPSVTFDASAVSWQMYLGEDTDHLRLAATDAVTNPITATALPVDQIGPPDTSTFRYRVIVTPIRHGGIWGSGATAIATNTITIPAAFTAHAYAGRVLGLYGSAKVINSLGIGGATFDGLCYTRAANFNVTDNDAAGNFTVTQSTLLSGFPFTFPGDAYVMRAQANIASANTIGDTGFINPFSPTGLGTDAEIGKPVWIIAGKGKGQKAICVGNNSTTLTITPSWSVVPDATSVFLVLEPASLQFECQPFLNDGLTGNPSLAAFAPQFTSLGSQSFLVQIVSVDEDGNTSAIDDAPWQEVFVPSLSSAPSSSYSVPVASGTAQPDASRGDNLIVLTAANTVPDPNGKPIINVVAPLNYSTVPGTFTKWTLILQQDPTTPSGGYSISFDASYRISFATASANSPADTQCHIDVKTDSNGITTPTGCLIDQPI